ncbi:MAG: hypothetical protein CBARDMAM_4701 [uncultured Caballeronia sp.]|nr:MAG: hypothetical protein CBARDMAM_4701 [uncultured Caballeronia sp.]
MCGIVVSSLGAGIPVYADSSARNFALHAETQPGLQAWKKEPVCGGAITETAPRGDLRGDIASNARARPEPKHSNRPPKH